MCNGGQLSLKQRLILESLLNEGTLTNLQAAFDVNRDDRCLFS